jgi:hypothetical protein
LLHPRGNGAGLETEVVEMLDEGLQILSGECFKMGRALSCQKCEEGEKEGGSTSEGAGSQVEPILMVEIALRVVGFWKIALAEPLDPLVECVGSFVIGSTNSKRRVIGESVVNVTWEY